MTTTNITFDDAIFFMDMVNSSRSPNNTPGLNKSKPYYKILDDPYSNQFKRFINVYEAEKHVLKAREQAILEAIYGINQTRLTMKKTGLKHEITPERVRQICYQSERKIVTSLLNEFEKELSKR